MQSERESAMRERIKQLLQPILLPLKRLRRGLAWLLTRVHRVWMWLQAIDIPLSPIQWVLLFYVLFGLGYMAATPIFEANDEIWHFGYVQHLRETGNLPYQQLDGRLSRYAQHGSQPPLYYGLMALLTSPFPIDDADVHHRLNPYVTANQPEAFGNKNLALPDDSRSPLAGAGLAVTLMRGLGLALGAGTIVMVYKISAYIAPQRPTVAFAAAALTALNPMFIFVSASVNNDSLAMTLNAALVLLMLRTLRGGFKLQYSLAIGLLFGLTSLTKLTSLALWPALLGLGLAVWHRSKDRRGLLLFLGSLLVFWVVIAAWWHVRNLQLYGEFFGLMTMAEMAGPRGVSFNLFAEYQQFRMSYWGLFGALNIQIAAIFYVLLDLMTFMSAIGCLLLILQLLAIRDFAYARYELRHLLLLLGILAPLSLGVLYWSALIPNPQGRTLFPLIAVISPLLAVGFVETVWWIVFSLRPTDLEFVRAGNAVPKALLHKTMLWPLRLLGIVALLAPFTVIASQYAAPPPLAVLPDNARPVYAEFGDVALIGYERINRRYMPGDHVRVKLYWQVLAQSTQDHRIVLTLVDDDQQEIGRYVSYPGAGRLRTSQWSADAIYADEYLIAIDGDVFGRYPFDLRVEWENLERGQIIATNRTGDSIAPALLDIGAIVHLRAQPTSHGFIEIAAELQPNFDEVIRLQEFLIDTERNEVVLNWKADASPGEDYTVFMHMLDADGHIAAQADKPPRLPTSYWRWGENYLTYHNFPADVSLREHTIAVGWYLNDGASYPRAEYLVQTEEEDQFLDVYILSWELVDEALEPSAEAESEATAAPGDEAEAEDENPLAADDS